MKQRTILAAILVFFYSLSNASDNGGEKALLWKVEGNGIKTSYIYGTFHMINRSDFFLSEEARSALQESAKLVLELDMDEADLQQRLMASAAMPGDHAISQMISEEDYATVDSALKATLGAGLAAFDKLKPFLVASMLMPTIMDEETASYEATFLQLAMADGKEILGLETPEEQMGLFDKISYQSQAEDLVEMVNERQKMQDIFKNMTDLYKDGDIEGLYDLFGDYYESPEEIDIMLAERNKNWIEPIQKIAGQHPSFFAVGAAHLGGQEGVIALLREAGYEVTPVK